VTDDGKFPCSIQGQVGQAADDQSQGQPRPAPTIEALARRRTTTLDHRVVDERTAAAHLHSRAFGKYIAARAGGHFTPRIPPPGKPPC